MGRYAQYPTVIEDLRFLDLKFLVDNNYLDSNTTKSGVITWNPNTAHSNSISIKSTMFEDSGYLTLYYTYNNDHKINYTVEVISKPSNLGKGKCWFFICPYTKRNCRKLHLINGYFRHRTYDTNIMYQKQIEPKIYRLWNKIYAREVNEHLYFELYSKYFKRFYNGKPTKRYIRIDKILQLDHQ